MNPYWLHVPDLITEPELVKLNIGDVFYDIDIGNSGKFIVTKPAERHSEDVGWKFEGKLVELNGKESIEKTIIPFFISDGMGFTCSTISLCRKYYEGETSDET